MKFVDIHNHILFGLDDGARTYEETLEMLKMAEQNKIEKLIVTPHFKENVVENDRTIILEKIKEVKEIITNQQLNIEIYPGSEIFLSKQSSKLLATNKIQTLNDSKYILVETHRNFTTMIYDLKEELYNLAVDGYKVILAHPERYEFTHENINFIYDLVNDGHLMQINNTSLPVSGHYHKIVRKLLDHNLVHFIASDAHDLVHRPLMLQGGYEQIKKHYSKGVADRLFYDNPLNVIRNESIEIGAIEKIKAKKWFNFKNK